MVSVNSLKIKNPIALAIGFFIVLFFLSACESEKTPLQVTKIFWQAMTENNLSLAKKYCIAPSATFLDNQITPFKQVKFDFGKIVIEGKQVTVETFISPSLNKKSQFTTFLIKEENHWKVDCQQSIRDLFFNPFDTFFKQLNSLGESVNKQLQEQMPLLEKEIESIGKEFKQQIDQFGKELKKALPEKHTNPYQDTI